MALWLCLAIFSHGKPGMWILVTLALMSFNSQQIKNLTIVKLSLINTADFFKGWGKLLELNQIHQKEKKQRRERRNDNSQHSLSHLTRPSQLQLLTWRWQHWRPPTLVLTDLLPESHTINGLTGVLAKAQRLLLLYLDRASFGQRMPFVDPCLAGCSPATGII